MTRLTNPQPLFLDASGSLLDAGYIYVGAANADPQDQPLAVFYDVSRMIPAVQPLRTMGGVVVNGAAPVQIFFAEADYSLRVLDADQQLVRYTPTAYPVGMGFQPLDTDLTAIAALATTEFGRALLTLADASALANATGIPAPLPAAGGSVSGAITRASSGKYLHHGDSSLVGDTIGRGTVDPSGGSDGDLYFQYPAS